MSTTDAITAELRELQSRANASLPPPSLQRYQNNLAEATAACLLDPDQRHLLVAAKDALTHAQQQHRDHAELRSRIAEINALIEKQAFELRMERIKEANRQLELADETYRKAAVACAWKYRELLTARDRNGRIAGANVTISPGPHIPIKELWVVGWNGTLDLAMQQGILPFENAKAFHDSEAA